MMMNPNILNQNPLMFFDRAVNTQRSQLLMVIPISSLSQPMIRRAICSRDMKSAARIM